MGTSVRRTHLSLIPRRVAAAAAVDEPRDVPRRGVLVQRLHRHSHAERSLQAPDELHREERVPAELEEVIRRADDDVPG